MPMLHCQHRKPGCFIRSEILGVGTNKFWGSVYRTAISLSLPTVHTKVPLSDSVHLLPIDQCLHFTSSVQSLKHSAKSIQSYSSQGASVLLLLSSVSSSAALKIRPKSWLRKMSWLQDILKCQLGSHSRISFVRFSSRVQEDATKQVSNVFIKGSTAHTP